MKIAIFAASGFVGKNVVEALQEAGVKIVALEPSDADARRNGDLKKSEQLFKNLLTLPLHHELTYEDQEYVCQTLKNLMVTILIYSPHSFFPLKYKKIVLGICLSLLFAKHPQKLASDFSSDKYRGNRLNLVVNQ